jgi:hypothetical protein
MDPIQITEEDLKKVIAEWAKKKGRQPNAIEVRKIYADMQKANSAQTEEERKRQEEKDKEPLTDSGIDMLAKQIIGSTPDMGAFQTQEMAAIPRTVSGDLLNTIDPLTGKTYSGLEQNRYRKTVQWTYYGMNLVDEQGKITNQQLTDNSGNAAANPLFQQLKMEGKLPQFLQALKNSQHYGGSSPSQMALLGQGMTNADYSAFDSFINSANLARVTPRAYMQMMDKLPQPGGSGGGGGVSYPSTADTNRYLRQASFEAFGRPMTPAEAKVAFQAVRAMYAKTSGAGGESAPSLDTATQQAVAQVSGEEGAIYNLGLALDRMFKGGGSI